MTEMSAQKSTTVRTRMVRLVGVLSLAVPSLAAAIAARLWFRIPPRSRAGLDVSGGTPFTTSVDGHVVRGTVWGVGPVVYLIHGWAGDSRQLAPLVEPLVAAGHQVVTFDGPSHGRSDPGALGPGRSHAVELADALGAVAARYGPARAVVAHSMGAMATMVTAGAGRLSVERLVFLAPMVELRRYLDHFAVALGLGDRARRRLDADLATRVGMRVEDFDLHTLASGTGRPPLLVVHDRGDRRMAWSQSQALVEHWPGARLVTTEGLGHARLLGDPAVHEEIVRFVRA